MIVRPSSRRSFFGMGAKLAAGSYVLMNGRSGLGALGSAASDPHFFLQIFIPGGLDAAMTFDARPLAMTAEKILVNYRGKDGIPYTGANGQTCLRTELIDSLMPHLDRFSIINGVLMSTDFDGHEDNQSYYLTGQPLGGEMFYEQLSRKRPGPMSSLRLGARLVADARMSAEGMLKLTDAVGYTIVAALQKSNGLAADPALVARLRRRFAPQAGETGSRAQTKRQLESTLSFLPDLGNRLAALKFPKPQMPGVGDQPEQPPPREPLEDFKTIANLFKGALTASALYVFDTDLTEGQNLDAHDHTDAQALVEVIPRVVKQVADILQFLRDEPFDDQRSLLDVTTVVVGTEFSRTMRQSNFEKSGTDHNSLTTSFLVGGKGCKGGLVVGASDCESVEAYRSQVSKAHRQLDRDLRKCMGKPFDFARGAASNEQPEVFKLEHYLTAHSVVNTVYSILGIPTADWRVLARGQPTAPLLTSLLG